MGRYEAADAEGAVAKQASIKASLPTVRQAAVAAAEANVQSNRPTSSGSTSCIVQRVLAPFGAQ